MKNINLRLNEAQDYGHHDYEGAVPKVIKKRGEDKLRKNLSRPISLFNLET